MIQLQNITDRLSQFNNLSLTRKQWEIILNGCSCPKSTYFWRALREICLGKKDNNLYTLINTNFETISKVYNLYSKYACANTKKAELKKKARLKVKNSITHTQGMSFFMINGYLTTEIPKRDK